MKRKDKIHRMIIFILLDIERTLLIHYYYTCFQHLESLFTSPRKISLMISVCVFLSLCLNELEQKENAQQLYSQSVFDLRYFTFKGNGEWLNRKKQKRFVAEPFEVSRFHFAFVF